MALQHLPRLTLCAAAVAFAVSGCSTAPTQDEPVGGIESVGSTLAEIGQAVVKISTNTVSGTAKALGFDRTNEDLGITAPGFPRASAGRLSLPDEIDMAMAEPDKFENPADAMSASADPMAANAVIIQPVERATISATAGETLELDPSLDGYHADDAVLADVSGAAVPADSQLDETLVVAAIEPTANAAAPIGTVRVQDADGKVVLLAPARSDSNATATNGISPEQAAATASAQAAAEAPLATDEWAAEVATSDYLHEVKAGESLWEIARHTTGDANNWHIVADVNALPLQHQLLPGQTLLIPADLVKPELARAGDPLPNNTGGDEVAAAATAADAPQSVEIQTANTTEVELGSGETLWDLAKRSTGDATNWRSIAAHNQLDEASLRRLAPGQVLYIPNAMIKSDAVQGTLAPKAVALEPVELDKPTEALAAQEPATLELIDTPSAAASAGAAEEVTIVEASYQPIDAEQLAPMAPVAAAPTSVHVSGTYYPKAVYNEADFSASLLTRVSPGTELTVSRKLGQWYEVQTDKGVGYVHARDLN